MKKLFAGLLLGTMALGMQTTVFAANEVQGQSDAVAMVKMVEANPLTIMVQHIEDLTPEQKAEMEKEQKEFENHVKEICEKAGYNYETMMDKMANGELTEAEKEVLSEAGIMMAVSIESSMIMEDLTPEQKVEMEKEQKEFEKRIKETCEKAGYDYETMMDKMKNGELTETEKEVLSEAGIMIAVCAESAIEIVNPLQLEEASKGQNMVQIGKSQLGESISATLIAQKATTLTGEIK